MSRLHWRATAATFLLSSVALAQPAEVALEEVPDVPGELQIGFWPSSGWAVQQFERFVEIRFPGEDLTVSTAGSVLDAFEGLLFAVESEQQGAESVLRLTLACDCQVALHGNPSTGLRLRVVGDFPDGRGLATAPQDAPIAPFKPTAQPALEPGPVAADEIDPAAVQARLLEQLRRAAAAGIVDLDGAAAAEPDTVPETVPESEANPIVAADPSSGAVQAEPPSAPSPTVVPEGTTPAEPTVAVEVPAEEEPLLAENVEPLANEPEPVEPQCFSNDAFELPEVVGEGVFTTMVSEKRAKLTGEFDQPNPTAAIDIVRVYLSGMAPEEAASALATFGQDHELSPLYGEIISVILEASLPGTPSLLKHDCTGDQALWRALAQAQAGQHAEALASEAVAGRALERLPLHVRQYAAGLLGLSAAAESDWTTARRFEALAERAAIGTQVPSGEALMLSAHLAFWHEEPKRALDLLAQARDTVRGHAAQRALLELADAALLTEDALKSDLSGLDSDLGALAFEMRGTRTGADAFERQARLRLLSGTEQDTLAFVNAGIEDGLYPEESHAELLAGLVSGAALDGLPRPLALIYMDAPDSYEDAIARAPFRRAVIRSMADIGVPDLAKDIIEPGDLDVSAVAVPLAQSFLEAGNPRDALDVAQEMPAGAEKDALLAAARAQLGQDQPVIAARPNLPVSVLEAKRDAAIADGRVEDALTAALDILSQQPAVDRAENVALLALRAGAPALPDAAAEIIGAESPGRLATIAALFNPVTVDPDDENPAAVTGFLNSIDAEISLIEGYLEDG
ncbi:MAG: hypothetical protein AAGK00_00375 [Pseudomonadota bacterium]